MVTRSELKNAILKGTGLRPTSFLLRWSPTFKKPLNFDLIEVSKCDADGGVVTTTMPQHSRAAHAGHKIISPNYFSLFELLKVQLRWIR
jgi:hypothetical protein